MGIMYRVKHQVRDVETYKIIKYELEDKYSGFSVTAQELVQYCKDGKLSNAKLFKDNLVYFELNNLEALHFIKYSYSEALKKKLEMNYQTWQEEQLRRQVLNIPEDVKYSFECEDGLYKLTNVKIQGDIEELSIPSFIAGIKQKGDMYTNNNILFVDPNKKWMGNTITSVFVDKYTDGLYAEMLSRLHDKVDFTGLIPVIATGCIYSDMLYFMRSDIDVSSIVTNVRLVGKTRVVLEKAFSTLSYNLNITAGRHLRVLFMDSNLNNLSCYDTTLLVGDREKVKTVIIKNTKKTHKDTLLSFKDYIEDLIEEYNNGIITNILYDRVTLQFRTEDCLTDFISHSQYKAIKEGNLTVSFALSDCKDKYKNSDSLYWNLKSEMHNRVISKAYEYAFAITI